MPSIPAQSQTTTSKQFIVISAILAFLMWAGWAYYANLDAAGYGALFSAIAQGVFSALATLVMVRVVTTIHNLIADKRLAVFLPAVLTVSVSSILLFLLHSFVGTSSIIKTILPPMTVAFLFCVFTASKLQQSELPHE